MGSICSCYPWDNTQPDAVHPLKKKGLIKQMVKTRPVPSVVKGRTVVRAASLPILLRWHGNKIYCWEGEAGNPFGNGHKCTVDHSFALIAANLSNPEDRRIDSHETARMIHPGPTDGGHEHPEELKQQPALPPTTMRVAFLELGQPGFSADQ